MRWITAAALATGACSSSTSDTTTLTPTTTTSSWTQGPTVDVLAWDHHEIPQAGVHVVVSHDDGSLHHHAQTADDGWVTVPLPEGGIVSTLGAVTQVRDGNLFQAQVIHSAFGLHDGDVFRSTAASAATLTEPDRMRITVHLSENCTLPAQTVGVEVQLSCDAARDLTGDPPSRGFDTWACLGRDTYDLYAFAVDADGFRIGTQAVLGLPFSANGTATHEVCPDQTSFEETILVLSGHGEDNVSATATLSGYRGDVPMGSDARRANPAPDPYVAAPRLPAGVFDTHGWSMSVDTTPFTHAGPSWVLMREGGMGELPVAIERTPFDVALVDEVTPSFAAPERPSVGWTLLDVGDVGSVIVASTAWTRNPSTETTHWRAWAPASRQGRVQLPELPKELVDFRPTASAVTSPATVEHMGKDDIREVGRFLETTDQRWFFLTKTDQEP